MNIVNRSCLSRFLILFFLLAGCSTNRVSVPEVFEPASQVQEPKKTVLVLTEKSPYKMKQLHFLSERMTQNGVELCIDDWKGATAYRAHDYGMAILIVGFNKGEPFSHEAAAFLENNRNSDNMILFVFKQKKWMQLPKDLILEGVVDTITSASLVKSKDDFVQRLGILLEEYLDL